MWSLTETAWEFQNNARWGYSFTCHNMFLLVDCHQDLIGNQSQGFFFLPTKLICKSRVLPFYGGSLIINTKLALETTECLVIQKLCAQKMFLLISASTYLPHSSILYDEPSSHLWLLDSFNSIFGGCRWWLVTPNSNALIWLFLDFRSDRLVGPIWYFEILSGLPAMCSVQPFNDKLDSRKLRYE